MKVSDLYKEYQERLDLELVAGEEGLSRKISLAEVHRPGLSLSGYLKGYAEKRILIFGKAEIDYLRDLSKEERVHRLTPLLTLRTPAVIVARRCVPPQELLSLCQKNSLPLFRSSKVTYDVLAELTQLLRNHFSPCMICHGTFVEVFGVGVLIEGESSVGKSEAALGLIEKGHRLISDDLVKVCKKEESYVEGTSMELSRHHMEVRGIGIINVAYMYGATSVKERKELDMIVHLEVWDDSHVYDRVGMEEKMRAILGIKVPVHTLPVKPGRDVVLLLETLVLNHLLKKMGYHSAKEFRGKLLKILAEKGEKRREKRVS